MGSIQNAHLAFLADPSEKKFREVTNAINRADPSNGENGRDLREFFKYCVTNGNGNLSKHLLKFFFVYLEKPKDILDLLDIKDLRTWKTITENVSYGSNGNYDNRYLNEILGSGLLEALEGKRDQEKETFPKGLNVTWLNILEREYYDIAYKVGDSNRKDEYLAICDKITEIRNEKLSNSPLNKEEGLIFEEMRHIKEATRERLRGDEAFREQILKRDERRNHGTQTQRDFIRFCSSNSEKLKYVLSLPSNAEINIQEQALKQEFLIRRFNVLTEYSLAQSNQKMNTSKKTDIAFNYLAMKYLLEFDLLCANSKDLDLTREQRLYMKEEGYTKYDFSQIEKNYKLMKNIAVKGQEAFAKVPEELLKADETIGLGVEEVNSVVCAAASKAFYEEARTKVAETLLGDLVYRPDGNTGLAANIKDCAAQVGRVIEYTETEQYNNYLNTTLNESEDYKSAHPERKKKIAQEYKESFINTALNKHSHELSVDVTLTQVPNRTVKAEKRLRDLENKEEKFFEKGKNLKRIANDLRELKNTFISAAASSFISPGASERDYETVNRLIEVLEAGGSINRDTMDLLKSSNLFERLFNNVPLGLKAEVLGSAINKHTGTLQQKVIYSTAVGLHAATLAGATFVAAGGLDSVLSGSEGVPVEGTGVEEGNFDGATARSGLPDIETFNTGGEVDILNNGAGAGPGSNITGGEVMVGSGTNAGIIDNGAGSGLGGDISGGNGTNIDTLTDGAGTGPGPVTGSGAIPTPPLEGINPPPPPPPPPVVEVTKVNMLNMTTEGVASGVALLGVKTDNPGGRRWLPEDHSNFRGMPIPSR